MGKPQSILALECHLVAIPLGENYTGVADEVLGAATEPVYHNAPR